MDVYMRDKDHQKTYKPFDPIKLCSFYGNIFILYPIIQC
jgi:hypothetical protein